MASLKEEIRSVVKETLREELSRALGVESKDRDDGDNPPQKTLSFEQFYQKREAERQKGFNPKRKKKEVHRLPHRPRTVHRKKSLM